jgi:outer membrane protein TolC
MRRFAAMALLLPSLALAADRTPRVLALPETIRLALLNNRELKALELTLQTRFLAVGAARSEFEWALRPVGTAQATGDRRDTAYGAEVGRKTEWGTEVRFVGQETGSSVRDMDDVFRDAVTVEIQQPLLRYAGRTANRENVTRAQSQVTAGRRAIELNRTDMVVRAAEAHERVFMLQRQMECESNTLVRLEQFLRLSKAREGQGRESRLNTLRAEQQRDAARLRALQAREQWRSAMAELADFLALPPETPLAVEGGRRLAVEIPGEDTALGIALSNRLDYAQVLQDVQDARRGVRIARQDLLPDLRVLSRYQRLGEGDRGTARRMEQEAWFLGLTVGGDLTLKKERIALDQAEVTRQLAELNVDVLRGALARQVLQSVLFQQRAEESVPAARSAYQAARRRVDLARRLFEGGRGSSATLSDAEDELQRAETEWLSAEADASVASYRLLRVLGRLIDYPEDLKPQAVKD